MMTLKTLQILISNKISLKELFIYNKFFNIKKDGWRLKNDQEISQNKQFLMFIF